MSRFTKPVQPPQKSLKTQAFPTTAKPSWRIAWRFFPVPIRAWRYLSGIGSSCRSQFEPESWQWSRQLAGTANSRNKGHSLPGAGFTKLDLRGWRIEHKIGKFGTKSREL